MRIKVETPDQPYPDEPVRYWLYVRDLDQKEPGTSLDVYCDSFAWSADGTEIAYTGPGKWTPEVKDPPPVHSVVNVATKKTTAVKLPADHVIIDWSRDGKYFLTRRADGPGERKGTDFPLITLHLMNRDGTEHKRLTDPKGTATYGRLSPDGKLVLYYGTGRPAGKIDLGDGPRLWILDIATLRTEHVQNVPDSGVPTGLCWSPDGKRIAYTWREFSKTKEEEATTEVRLVVCDPDGKDAKTIATHQEKASPVQGEIDWR